MIDCKKTIGHGLDMLNAGIKVVDEKYGNAPILAHAQSCAAGSYENAGSWISPEPLIEDGITHHEMKRPGGRLKISVIVPVYNMEKYLEKCLDSICGQTLKDIEIICVNDASTDNSLSLLKDYAVRDARIRVVDMSENSGVSAARNRGIEQARGEYIYFIDPDDWIDNCFLEVLHDKIKELDADIIINTNYVNEYDDESKNAESSFPAFPNEGSMMDPHQIQREFPPVIWARLYRRDFLCRNGILFPIIKGGGEDIWFTAACELHLDKVYVFRSPCTYHYYQRQSSLTHTAVRGFHYIESFSALFDYLLAEGIATDGLKLFFVESLILDTEEKYTFVRDYLLRIRPQFMRNEPYYSDQDKFLMKIVSECPDYAAFRASFNPNIALSFIRYRMTSSK